MFKRNQIYFALVATTLSLGATQAFAQETVSSVATVTVSNAFTLQEVTAIDFGTFRVSYLYDGTNALTAPATAQVLANGNPTVLTNTAGAAGTSVGAFTEILPGAPAEYAITGAAPFTSLNVTLPSAATLINPASPGAVFDLTFTSTNFEIVGGTNDGDAYDTANSGNMITDAAGSVGFKMGATIGTPTNVAATFGDGAYTGTYTVVVNY
jgi:hypothetical protein